MRPLKELKAFKKPFLNAGEKVNVGLELNVNELAYYSEEQMTWIVEPGEYEVIAAASAKDIKGSVRIYVE